MEAMQHRDNYRDIEDTVFQKNGEGQWMTAGIGNSSRRK